MIATPYLPSIVHMTASKQANSSSRSLQCTFQMAASTLLCILLLSGHCDSFSLLLHIIVPFILVYTTRWKQQTISLALLFGIMSDKSSNAHNSVIIIHEHAQLEPYHHCRPCKLSYALLVPYMHALVPITLLHRETSTLLPLQFRQLPATI